jgi:signal transduction histidine kinase
MAYLIPGSFAFACLMLTLGLTERMVKIRRERHEAQLEARQRGRQLATASHDIRQPLLSLRTTIARLTEQGGLAPSSVERLRNSVEYLDKLAR